MIKRITKYILILVLFSNVCMSQNAFSDALLMEKNSETYITKIKSILEPHLFYNVNTRLYTVRQQFYLKNVLNFLINPWDSTVTLDLKIFKEIPEIISNYFDIHENIKQYLAEKQTEQSNLNDEISNLKTSKNSQTDIIEINKLDDSINEKNVRKDTLDSIVNKLKSDTGKVGKITRKTGTYTEFINGLSETKNILSPLGKDNEEKIKEVSKESHFALSQSAIIDALGNAIVEQVKEDLIRIVFDNIFEKQFMVDKCDIEEQEEQGNGLDLDGTVNECDCLDIDTIRCTSLELELNVLFPSTIKLLKKLKSANNEVIFTDINSSLKNSFNDDLNNMLDNLTNEKNLSESKIFGKYIKNSENYSYFKFGVVLTRQLRNGFHPTELFPIISDWVEKQSKKDTAIWSDLSKYFSLVNLLQKNLRDVTLNSKNIWINLTQLEELKKNEVKIKDSNINYKSSAEFFLALLYQTDKTKYSYIREKFYDEKKGFKDNEFESFKDDLKSFVTMLRIVEQNTNNLTNKSDINIEDYEVYLDNLDSTLSNTNNLLGKYFVNETIKANIQTKLTLVHKYRNFAFDILKSIVSIKYSKILPVVLQMFETQINDIADSVAFKKELIRYTTLYVDITNAKTQEELNSAIYKSVHSSGGFLRKVSENRFMVTVNSYPGFFLGCESVNKGKYQITPGLSVPLGFTLQFDRYIGLFLQGFDIAAAVSYRFSSDNTSTLPDEVTFRQVFSPGLYAAFTFFDFPLSINIGGYFTPALRKIEGSSVTLDQSESFRLGINFSYDVPLWYLF